jgi:hypothetical protein
MFLLKDIFMFRQILGPSPVLYGIKKYIVIFLFVEEVKMMSAYQMIHSLK